MMPEPERLLPGMKLTAIYKKKSARQDGITLIELIVTIVLLAIVILPTAKLFQQLVETMNYCNNKAMANNLLRNEMSLINNLSFSGPALTDGYDNTTADYEGYGFNLRRQVNIVTGTNNAIKRVVVGLTHPSTSAVIAQAATYVAQNVSFGAGSGGGTPGSGQSDSLTVTGGSISEKKLQNVTLVNTSASSITITGVIVSFTGSGGIKLKKVKIAGDERWEGNLSSPATIDFTDNGNDDFTLNGSTTYNNTLKIKFSKNLSTVSVIFVMIDGSQTSAYNWP